MPQSLDQLVDEILQSRKYRDMNLCADTVRDLLERELRQSRSQKEALKAVRTRLHNVAAPYLGDPDYPAAFRELDAAAETGSPDALRAVCREILAAHASTRERLPLLDNGFYPSIFEIIGLPETILDVACGLNPFSFPWMGLPSSTRYHAYDIHGPRIELINHYFRLQGVEPLAEQRDILIRPPEVEGQVAFLFKEAHRMEQRRRGSTRPLLEALPVHWLAVSLPAHSLSGRFDLLERQRQLVSEILGPHRWPVSEVLVGDEMIFLIEKIGEEGL